MWETFDPSAGYVGVAADGTAPLADQVTNRQGFYLPTVPSNLQPREVLTRLKYSLA